MSITSTSGVSGLTGGNCTREEYTAHQQYSYPVGEDWVAAMTPPLTPGQTIANEILAARELFERVHYDEGASMCGENLSRLAQGIRILAELELALLT